MRGDAAREQASHCIFIAIWSLAAAGGVASGSVTQAAATQTLQFYGVANGSRSLADGTLSSGTFKLFLIPSGTCSKNDSLTLELWDLEGGGTGKAFTQTTDEAQPFLVGNRGSPPAAVFNVTSNAWDFDPKSSVTDLAGETLSRPYLRVQETFGAPGSDNTSDWYVMILNAQLGMPRQLLYQLRVSCTTVPICPAPLWSGTSNTTEPCSANGECRLVTGVPGGEWRYFAITLPNQTAALVAEMRRARGDPILFLKGAAEGEEPGALPSALDFGTFADAPSWRTRSDTAQILRSNVRPGLYYIGVLNNAEDIQEAANYTLTLRLSPQGPLCPWNCNGNGNCLSNGICECRTGFGGKFCDGPLTPLTFSNTATGILQPGSWAYFRLDLTNRESRTRPLTVKFDNSAGQSIVLASFKFFPTLLTTNFTFRAGQITGQMSQVLQTNSLIADDLNFGIYNMNFYVHSPFNFQLSVSQNKSSKADYTSWISVGAALGCSGLIVFIIYHSHRAVQRRRLGARGWEMWSWRAMPVVQPLPRRRRSVRRRGLDPALVQSFPTYAHDADKLAKGISQTPKSEQPSEDEKACSVCLGEYEDGDLIRQLLPCRHDFHCKCIDQWLAKNSTCPMCRILLVPPGHQREESEAAVGGGEQLAEASPPAAQEVRIEMIEDPEDHAVSRPNSDTESRHSSVMSEANTLPSSQHSVAGSSIEEGRRKEPYHPQSPS